MFQALAVAIKRQDSPSTRWAYRILKGMRRLELPAPALVYRPLLWLYLGLKTFWDAARRTLLFQPMFRARCERCGPGLLLYMGFPYLYGDLRLSIGAGCKIHGRTAFAAASLFDAPTLILGDQTNIGFGVVISVARRVEIGRFVRIADGCYLADNPGHRLDPLGRRSGAPVLPSQVKPVVIEDDVWLGGGVRVMPGVRIGKGTVVGAGSVVTHSLPAGCLAAGVPARVIRVGLWGPTPESALPRAKARAS